MPKKILVVDDEAPLRTLLTERLTDNGYIVFSAAEAYQAVQIAQSQLPDLIILDIRMPAGGGINAYNNIRRIGQLGATPIIFSTAYVDDTVLKKVEQDPSSSYIAKPFPMNTLLEMIKKYLHE